MLGPSLLRPSFCIFTYIAILGIGGSSFAQFTTIINAPPSKVLDGSTISSDTQINVTINGEVGDFVTLGTGSQNNSSNNELNLRGGTIGDSFTVTGLGNVINIRSGIVGDDFNALNSSTVNIFGAAIGNNFRASSNTAVQLSGGTFGDGVIANDTLTILGDDFRVNGLEVAGLDNVGDFVSLDLSEPYTLSGTFQDGNPFAFSWYDVENVDADSLTLRVRNLPAIGPTNISVPTDSAPAGIRQGQTLTVESSGTVAVNFNAGHGSAVVVDGGDIGNNLEAVGAEVTVVSGSIGEGLDAFDGTTVNVQGGTIGQDIQITNGSELNLSAGEVGGPGPSFGYGVTARANSVVNVTGGVLLRGLRLDEGSTATISAGEVRSGSSIRNGSSVSITGGVSGSFRVTSDSSLMISGGSTGLINGSGNVEIQGGTVALLEGNGTTTISAGTISQGFEILGGEITVTGGDIEGSARINSAATADIQGGAFQDLVVLGSSTAEVSGGNFGDGFQVNSGSTASLLGGEFRLNGEVLEEVGSIGESFTLDVPVGSVISGTLSDGSTFALHRSREDFLAANSVILENVALPSAPLSVTLPTDPVPPGARAGQIVNVNSSGALGDNFVATNGSTLNIDGGSAGENLETVGAEVNLLEGEIGNQADAFSGSVFNIFDGLVGGEFQAHEESTINVRGGVVGSDFEALDGSIVNISGGNITRGFNAFAGSEINVFGTGFRINEGQPLLSNPGDSLVITTRGRRSLNGFLADGTPFSFGLEDSFSGNEDYFDSDATLRIIQAVPEPTAMALSTLALLLSSCCRSCVSEPSERVLH